MNGRYRERGVSRRAVLGSISAAAGTAIAGCLGFGGGEGQVAFEPQELSDPPSGTPGELHYAIEERTPDYDLTVESVYENDDDLLVAYHSDAAASMESARNESDNSSVDVRVGSPLYNYTMEEAGVIAQAFNEICVKHGDGPGYEMLVAEIENPVDDQPWGCGARTEWFEAYNEGEMSAMEIQQGLGQYVVFEEDVASDGSDA